MPFGLDLKSLIVGFLLAWFLPMLASMITGLIGSKATPAPAGI